MTKPSKEQKTVVLRIVAIMLLLGLLMSAVTFEIGKLQGKGYIKELGNRCVKSIENIGAQCLKVIDKVKEIENIKLDLVQEKLNECLLGGNK